MGYLEIYQLQKISGANEKKKFLAEHSEDEWVRKFLYYALNPLLTYNISETTLYKLLDSPTQDDVQKLLFFNDIFECCEYLSRLRGIDDATLRQVCTLLNMYEDVNERDLYVKLLSKTVRLGVTAKTVNKVMPKLIPEWEVQQAFPIDKYPVKNGDEFWLTQKLNGARATLYNGQLIARSGVPYKGLKHIINELDWVAKQGFVLDGELTLRDTNGLSDNEAFRISTGILNSDDENKTSICFTIFDMVHIKDFDSATPTMKYAERRGLLDGISSLLSKENDYVRVLRFVSWHRLIKN